MRKLISLAISTIIFFGIYSCSKPAVTCPSGYTGANCATQITPSQIQITKVSVTNFPSVNPAGGGDWQAVEGSGYADIYPTVSDASGNVLHDFSAVYLSAASNQNINSFTPANPIILSSALSAYTFSLYNHNALLADDLMGSATNVLYNPYGAFPSTITVTGSGVTFVLSVKYLW